MSLTVTRERASALLLSAATMLSETARAQSQPAFPLRICTFSGEAGAQAFYAQDMGFFAKAGIDATIEIVSGGGPAMISSGAYDLGWMTIDGMGLAYRNGIPLVAFAPATEYVFSPTTRPTQGLMVAANSPIRQAQDLNGKILAVTSLNGISEDSCLAWIDQNGGDSSTVKVIQIPQPAVNAALGSGRIDAAYVPEPFLSALGKDGRMLGDPMSAIAKHFLSTVWGTTRQWADGHPGLVRRYAAVMHQTAVWANANPVRSAPILAKYDKLDPAVVARIARVHFATDQLSAALIQPVIDTSAKYNKFTPFPAQGMIYTPGR